MIDIFGDDPSITPAQLCHGDKVYRAVDLGVRVDEDDKHDGYFRLTLMQGIRQTMTQENMLLK